MTFLWISISCLIALVWVLSIVDIFRQHYSGWTTVGWIALVVILPIIGTMIYWFAHKPESVDAETAYRAQADQRRADKARPPRA